MSERLKPLELDDDSSVGDFLEAYLGETTITIRIDNPWAGDTETGLGRDATVDIEIDNARKLRDWLNRAITAMEGQS